MRLPITGIGFIVAYLLLTLDEPDSEARIRASLPANPVMDPVAACTVADQQVLAI